MAFERKVNSLMSTSPSNGFVREAMKASHETSSGNGALKYDTSGDDFVDQFANAARYKEPRSFADISKDMELLWSQDPHKAIKLAVYFRLITRKASYVKDGASTETSSTQRGQGLKNEGIMRIMWIAINHPTAFKANIWTFIAAGSWKDIITMLNLDLQYHGWKGRKLDWKFLGDVIDAGLMNPDTAHLVRKYLPTIRTNKKCKTLEAQADTLIGRWLAHRFFGASEVKMEGDKDKAMMYNNYRKIKSCGVAHQWQQKISQELYNEINFDTIAGKALAQLVGSKFLANHGLEEKYEKWIESRPVAKFTGYVHEVFAPLEKIYNLRSYQEKTINAQFAQLVAAGKSGASTQSKLLVVRDTSGSMSCTVVGCNMSSNSIAKAMALYFSEFLDGPFKGHYAEFADTCTLRAWKGNTATERWRNDRYEAYGSTNFLGVAELLIKVKRSGVPESDFPDGILAISDGEFNLPRDWGGSLRLTSTNFQQFRSMLAQAGFSKEYVENFKLILWDIPNGFYGGRKTATFEDFADAPNNFYLSGYDPAAVAFIMGTEYHKSTPKTASELFDAAMDQELLNTLWIPEKKK